MNKYDGSSQPGWIRHLDKGLLAGGMIYLLLVSAWLFFQSRQTQETPIAVTDKAKIVTPQDREFIAYLQQSLETLQQPTAAASPTPAAGSDMVGATVTVTNSTPLAPPPPPGANPPMATAPPPIAAAGTSPSTTVVERYYYPVYPNNAPPSQPVAPAPPPPVAQVPVAQVPMVTSATKHDLVGVLESGDRSSALFRWNNMTQKIQLGEAIGSSGWQLTSVVGQKAILSRQGKTRYLEVGQSF